MKETEPQSQKDTWRKVVILAVYAIIVSAVAAVFIVLTA